MIQRLLDIIGRHFDHGSLELAAPNGKVWTLGRGEPVARVLLRNERVIWRILRNPRLGFGETYMDGDWTPEDGDLRHVLEVCLRMLAAAEFTETSSRAMRRLRNLATELNSPRRSQHNVHHHYEIDQRLYESFLDPELFYSCAYFERPELSLADAQQAKCAHIARKLRLKPGARVLDVGCGWGGLARHLAQRHDVHVTGITLASDQAEVAVRRAAECGLSDRIEIRVEDYRNTQGQYDAIVSVGMFEHVGRPQYPVFFKRMSELLKPDGVALLHTIGRLTPPGATNPWIRKYIFPGGYSPAASEVMTAIEPSRLYLCDLEVLRLHYARTLGAWLDRFNAARAALAARLGERFCRMWEFYLVASELNFVHGQLAVFHFQLAHDIERVPITRQYLHEEPVAPPRQAELGLVPPRRSAARRS